MAERYIRKSEQRRVRQVPRGSAAYYTADSTARQLAPMELPRHDPRVAPGPRPRPQPRPRKKQKPVKVKDIQHRLRNNFLSYVILVAFFGGVALVLGLNAIVTYNTSQLESARTRLAALESSNAARAREIYAGVNMEEIERIAREYLHMAPPEDFQIVEIRVDPQSFFVHTYNTRETLQSGFSFARFLNTLFSFGTD